MKVLYLTLTSGVILFGLKSHSISASSNPQGVEIHVGVGRMGITPLKLELNPSNTYSIEYRKNRLRSHTKKEKLE